MIRIDLIRERFYKARESIAKTKKCPYSLELDYKNCCLVGNPEELDNYQGEKCPYLLQEKHKVGRNPEVRADEYRSDDVKREEYLDRGLYQCAIPKEDVDTEIKKPEQTNPNDLVPGSDHRCNVYVCSRDKIKQESIDPTKIAKKQKLIF